MQTSDHYSRRRTGKKPVLCFVVNQGGFFLSHRLPLAIAARDAGFEVLVACPPSDADVEFHWHGLNRTNVARSRGTSGPFAALALVRDYFRLLRRQRPALVHLITSKPVIFGGIIARLLGIPTVAAISGMGFIFSENSWKVRLIRPLVLIGYRLALSRPACHIIFQNEDDRTLFNRHGLLRRPTHSMIDGSGVDLDRFRWQPEPPGPAMVLLPSRMLRDKGVGEFIAAARTLRERGVAAIFRLQGGIDQANPNSIPRAELEALAGEGNIAWHDHSDAIETVLAASHIVALPSYYGEGLPKTIVDASAAGRPIVTTDWPGCRHAIEPGVTGLLVRPRDAVDLADKLEELIRAPERRRAMGKAARRLAERRFDVRRIAAAHVAIYRDMLGIRGVSDRAAPSSRR